MGSFKNKAIAATTVSKIMEGKTKISTEELLAKYPEGVTIIGFDWLKGEDANRILSHCFSLNCQKTGFVTF